MPVSVVDPNPSYLIRVPFHSDTIQTLLTSEPSRVDSWLSETLRLHHPQRPLIVGIDTEWRRPNRHKTVAILQLCINRRCLVFQIFRASFLPQSLSSFLSNPNHTFVGVGVQGDVDKLLKDYSLPVSSSVDLRSLAADVLGDPDMMGTGLKTLAQRVLGKDVEKPRKITMSKWDC